MASSFCALCCRAGKFILISDFTSVAYTGANFNTYEAPAVAGRTSPNPRWVAAWPLKKDLNYVCTGIPLATSTDDFSTLSNQQTLANDCTAHPVALEWDQSRQRFVLMYVYQSPLHQSSFSYPAIP